MTDNREPTTLTRVLKRMPPYRRVAPLPLLICTAGCPVPISHTETLSPPVVGVVRKSDGTPVVGAQIAVAYGYARSPCTRATSLATTDSTGAFRLVATQKDYRVVWVIPNLDRAPPSYLLCVGAGDTLWPAYTGWGSLDAEAEPDSVTCLQWEWRDQMRVTCSGKAQRAVVEGGKWADEDAAGWYRLILTSEDSGRTSRPLAVVQWLEQSGPGSLPILRATAELPFRGNVEWGVAEPALGEIYGRWCASMLTLRKTHFGFKREWLRFKLGLPGDAHPVSQC